MSMVIYYYMKFILVMTVNFISYFSISVACVDREMSIPGLYVGSNRHCYLFLLFACRV